MTPLNLLYFLCYNPVQSNLRILVEIRQKLRHTCLKSIMRPYILQLEIQKLRRCLTLHLKHSLRIYFRFDFTEVELFSSSTSIKRSMKYQTMAQLTKVDKEEASNVWRRGEKRKGR